jgi:hypothetical protein
MKRGWLWLLLLSLGLNVGLGLGLLSHRSTSETGSDPPRPQRSGFRFQPTVWDSVYRAEQAHHRVGRLARRLGLAPEMGERLGRVHMEALPGIHRHRLAVHAARGRLHQAVLAPEPAPDSVRVLLEDLHRAQARLDSLVTETLLRELSLLSPEERARYLAMMPWDFGGGPRGPAPGRRGGLRSERPGHAPRQENR